MNRLFFALVLVCAMALSSVFAGEESIVVRVTGEGENRTEALENALRNAVRKVVGTYVVSQKFVKDEDFEEDIYINADAVVTQHKELRKTEDNGVVTLEIEATVVKNDLLKYVKKTQSTKISETDTANLLVKRRALKNAEKSLDYIFKDYAQKIYQMKQIGDLDISPDDDVSSDNCTIIISYEVVFCAEEYAKFKKRLQNLFDKVAIESKTATFAKCDRWEIRRFYEAFWKDSGYDSNQGYRIVSFLDDNGGKGYGMIAYIVPNQVHRKIVAALGDRDRCAIDFSFDVRHSAKPVRRIMLAKLSFWGRPYVEYFSSDSTLVEFHNFMYMDVDGYNEKWFETGKYKKSWALSEDDVEALRKTTIRAFSGDEARFLLAKFNHEWGSMNNLAYEGYVPAMNSMVEDFDRSNDGWYERAALRNSRHAQNKLGWKNSGFGFSIVKKDDRYIVADVQKGVQVKRDMVIKKINGKQVAPLSSKELSEFVGKISSGSVVHIEFTNGKIVDVVAQD